MRFLRRKDPNRGKVTANETRGGSAALALDQQQSPSSSPQKHYQQQRYPEYQQDIYEHNGYPNHQQYVTDDHQVYPYEIDNDDEEEETEADINNNNRNNAGTGTGTDNSTSTALRRTGPVDLDETVPTDDDIVQKQKNITYQRHQAVVIPSSPGQQQQNFLRIGPNTILPGTPSSGRIIYNAGSTPNRTKKSPNSTTSRSPYRMLDPNVPKDNKQQQQQQQQHRRQHRGTPNREGIPITSSMSMKSMGTGTTVFASNKMIKKKGPSPPATQPQKQQQSHYRSLMIDHILEGTGMLRCRKEGSQRKVKKKKSYNSRTTSKSVYSKLMNDDESSYMNYNNTSYNEEEEEDDDDDEEEPTADEKWRSYVLSSLTKKKSFKWNGGRRNNKPKVSKWNLNTTPDTTDVTSETTSSSNQQHDPASSSDSENSNRGSDGEDDDDDDEIQIAQETASFISFISQRTKHQQQQQCFPSTSTALLRGGNISNQQQQHPNRSLFLRFVHNDTDPNGWLWNYSFVFLSALDYRKNMTGIGGQPITLLNEKGCWDSNLFTSSEERMVKESIRHYIRLHLSTLQNDSKTTNPTTAGDSTDMRSKSLMDQGSEHSSPVDVDAYYMNNKRNNHAKKSSLSSRQFLMSKRNGTAPTVSVIKEDDTESINDITESENLAIELLQGSKYDNTITVLKVLLDKQEKIFQETSKYHNSQSKKFYEAESAVTNTLRKLTMVCIAAGSHRQKEASKYNTELMKRLQKYTASIQDLHKRNQNKHPSNNDLAMQILQAIVNGRMEEGLVHCNNNRVGKALKSWREAIHMVIGVTGYPQQAIGSSTAGTSSGGGGRNRIIAPHLPALFNNIGVLHLTSGALQDSIRTLEESIDFQKINLRYQNNDYDMLLGNSNHSRKGNNNSNTTVSLSPKQFHLENSLFQLATTISNLAIVYERNYQYEKAMSLLDEALSVLESIHADTSDMEQLIENNQKRLLHDQDALFNGGAGGIKDDTKDKTNANNTFDTDDNSIDSARSSILFGNIDGIPDNQASRRRRSLASRLTMELSDQHDFLLLGPLHHRELSTEQRVRETVYVWFGKRIPGEEYLYDSDDDSLLQDSLAGSFPPQQQQLQKYRSLKDSIISTVLTYGDTTITGTDCHSGASTLQKCREAIPVDIDGNNVVNAELHLNAIYRQAMIHLDRNEGKDALELFRSTLRNHREKYGDIHHLVGTALHNIGMVHLFARQYDEAILAFQEAVNVRVAALGMDHPDVQLSMIKIALIQMAIGNLSGSRATFWEIRDKSLEILGSGHPNLAKIMNNIGVVAYECGDIVNALRSFEIAYEYQRRFYENIVVETSAKQGPETISKSNPSTQLPTGNPNDLYNSNRSKELAGVATANILCNMGFVYGKDAGEKAESLKVYESALKLFEEHLSPDDYRISEVRMTIDYLIKVSLDGYHNQPPSKNSTNGSDQQQRSSTLGLFSCTGVGGEGTRAPSVALKASLLLEERRQQMCTIEGLPSGIPEEISTIHRNASASSTSSSTLGGPNIPSDNAPTGTNEIQAIFQRFLQSGTMCFNIFQEPPPPLQTDTKVNKVYSTKFT